MIPNLNNVRLRDKMLLLYFLCVFVPILLTNFIFYNVTTTSVKISGCRTFPGHWNKSRTSFFKKWKIPCRYLPFFIPIIS